MTLLCVPLLAQAQAPHQIVRSLEAYKQPNGVLIRWIIVGGGQCQGTKIYRSVDEANYIQIGHIDGICGSTDAEETYTFFDSVPHPNTYNHYKLEMGFQGFTTPVTVFFEDFGTSNYSLLSDYESGVYRILFSNDLKNEAVLEVYDRSGNVIFGATSTDSDIEFRPKGWKSGIYIFRIAGVSQVDISGKFYIGGP